jgi:drug/metabolite transporter (DMT)-like permease
MKNQNKSYLFALAAVILWSTVATAFKIALSFSTIIQMLTIASVTSTVSIFIILYFSNNHNKLLQQKPIDYYKSALYGLLNPFIYYLVLFKAYSLLPAREAQPLNYTWVLVVSLLSVIVLKQKIKWLNFIALFVSFAGVVVISTRGDILGFKFSNVYGVLLAVGSSLIWGAYWILNLKDRRHDTIKLFWNFLFGSVFSIIALIVSNSYNIEIKGITSSVYIGLFEMGITFFLWMKALSLSENTAEVGNIIYLSPFISLIFIHFILGEEIMISSFVGLLLIIFGVVIQK